MAWQPRLAGARIMNAGNNLKQRSPEIFLCYRPCGGLDLIDVEQVDRQKINPHMEIVRGTRLVVQSLCGLGLVGRGPL